MPAESFINKDQISSHKQDYSCTIASFEILLADEMAPRAHVLSIAISGLYDVLLDSELIVLLRIDRLHKPHKNQE